MHDCLSIKNELQEEREFYAEELEEKDWEFLKEAGELFLIHAYTHLFQIPSSGYEVLGGLLDTFITAYNEYSEKNLSPKNRSIINLLPKRIFYGEKENPELYHRLLRIIDFVSGMTDSYAVSIFRKIKGISLPGGRVTE